MMLGFRRQALGVRRQALGFRLQVSGFRSQQSDAQYLKPDTIGGRNKSEYT